MDAEVDHAAAAREARVVEPRLVRSVRVVEDEVDRVHVARARPSARARRSSGIAGDVAVRQVDAEQPVGGARGVDDPARLRRRPARAASGRTPRRPRSSARIACSACSALGRRDHDAVERRARAARRASEATAQPGASAAAAAAASGDRVGDRGDAPRGRTPTIASMPVAADPADAEEAEPGRALRRAASGSRSRGHERLHEAVRALLASPRTPRPSRSSGNGACRAAPGRAAPRRPRPRGGEHALAGRRADRARAR